MGLFSNWKPHTIAGKILKGVVAVGAPIAGAVTGVGAVAGMIGGIGAVSGIGKAAIGVAKIVNKGFTASGRVVSHVAEAAANIATGTNKDQRLLIREQKEEQDNDIGKLKTIEKLINAGSTVQNAASKVGVPLSQLAGLFGIPSDSDIKTAEFAEQKSQVNSEIGTVPMDNKKLLTIAAIGIAGLFLLPKIFKRR
jgi:hypothetical protein